MDPRSPDPDHPAARSPVPRGRAAHGVARRRGRTWGTAVLGLVLAATAALPAACASSSDDAGEAPAERVTVTLPVPPTTVTLLDPGAEPRGELAYQFAHGTESEHLVTARSTIAQVLGGDPEQDFSRPEVTLPLTARIGASNAMGQNVTLTVGAATSPDENTRSALDDAPGSEATLRISPSGAVHELTLSPSPQSNDTAREALEHAMFQTVYGVGVMPSEPVGPGARWLIEQPIESATDIVQSTTVTLLERTGNRIVLDVSVNQQPSLEYFDTPGAGRLLVDTFSSNGSGRITIDLAQPLPISGQVEVRGEQQYSDPATGFTLQQTTGMALTWSQP
ncbi:hypothetical protein HT102_14890 [Hoyosella sp. G463]|uniref:Uncharacterized protein n=1 Tax=Lolliginicoccus lacisalsi TaxID=2742202 RepID=A0A927JEA7_9ACTN|nr:hypothetical protein [Lolliginicoccus lacisalsi]MBD8507773.1 hypothetical protein [Lolliginicoccus lacisalsi]